jgi:hypothetical protein
VARRRSEPSDRRARALVYRASALVRACDGLAPVPALWAHTRRRSRRGRSAARTERARAGHRAGLAHAVRLPARAAAAGCGRIRVPQVFSPRSRCRRRRRGHAPRAPAARAAEVGRTVLLGAWRSADSCGRGSGRPVAR